MNEDGTVYPFDPFAGLPTVPLLTPPVISLARSQNNSWVQQRAAHFASRPQAQAEYALLNALEILWQSVRGLLSTYARLGIGTRVATEDDLGYEDDLLWMGVKTEIGAAGEGVRKLVSSTTGPSTGSAYAAAAYAPSASTASQGKGKGKSSSPSSSKGSPAASTSSSSGPPGGEMLLHRLRQGITADEALSGRSKTLVRIYDALVRGKGEMTNWFTEKAVLRRSVYSTIISGFRQYPIWHEDRAFVDQFMAVVASFVDYDR